MFSLFGKKKTESAPTTVNPLLQAELQRVEALPIAPPAPAPKVVATCTKYGIGGKPPQVVLKTGQDEILASNADFGFVISDRQDRAVLMNLPHEVPDARIELWQLASQQDLRLVRKINTPIHPNEASWGARFLDKIDCLPIDRALVSINYFVPLRRSGLFLYDMEQQRFSVLNDDVSSYDSRYVEVQRLGEHAAMVLYFSDSKRQSAETYHNYYNHFRLFTRAHPDGLDALKLGIDTGNVRQWFVTGEQLYLAHV